MPEDFILQRADRLLIQSYGEYNGELLVKLTDGTLMVVASILLSGDVPPPPKPPRAAKQKRGLKGPVLEAGKIAVQLHCAQPTCTNPYQCNRMGQCQEQDRSQDNHNSDGATL